jgi:hypothetical protein
MKKKLVISYDQGYNNWYVSEFYKFLHKKLDSENNFEFEYVSLRELSTKFGKDFSNHYASIFNWFNFVIYNPLNEKMFIHSWYDYAPEIIHYSIQNDFNVVKFSCVSNLTEDVIQKYKNIITVEPSIYYLENWSDIQYIQNLQHQQAKITKSYFNGLNHGLRQNIMSFLSKNDFFDIKSKTNPSDFRQKNQYYEELSNYKFGLSLNGAANICYRDLELFGLGVLNLRQPLNSMTYNKLEKDIHYIEFLDDDLTNKIIYNNNENVEKIIESKVNELIEFSNTQEFENIISESKKWFVENCLPENQYRIILSLLNNLDILY